MRRWIVVGLLAVAVCAGALAWSKRPVAAQSGPRVSLTGLGLTMVAFPGAAVHAHEHGVVLIAGAGEAPRYAAPWTIAVDEMEAGEAAEKATQTAVLANDARVEFATTLSSDAAGVVSLEGTLVFGARRFYVRCVEGEATDTFDADPRWCLPYLASIASET